MIIKPATKAAYDLLHQGTLALAQVEANGMRIDVEYLDKTIRRTDRRIEELQSELQKDKIYRRWVRRFGRKVKWEATKQLATIVFDELGHSRGKELRLTEHGDLKNDEQAFSHLDIPFIKKYFEMRRLLKTKTTFLLGIRREVVDGFLHPNQNLNLAQTYRSSSSNPNAHNFPVRKEGPTKLVRSSFIARGDDYLFAEIDYKGIETRIPVCYCHDPTLTEYIKDETKDMHRDMAQEIFIIPQDKVSPLCRYVTKNMFVFPTFYGSFFKQCAPHLWDAIEKFDFGWIKKHLAKKGITELGRCDFDEEPEEGTFEAHLAKIEHAFWYERFPVYNQWRKDWVEAYNKNGFMYMLSGFKVEGYHRRNDIINYPIQGFAFHCLLYSIIEFQKWLTKNKMKTKIIGQIHDSILLDIHRKEVQIVLTKLRWIMTEKVRKHWPVICIPLVIDVDIAPKGKSWFHKEKWICDNGTWKPKPKKAA